MIGFGKRSSSFDQINNNTWVEDRYDISVSKKISNGEKVVEVTAVSLDDPTCQTVCDIVYLDGRWSIYSAFAIAFYEVALPDDILPQMRANHAIDAALIKLFEREPEWVATLSKSLWQSWEHTYAWLSSRWVDAEERGYLPLRPGLQFGLPRKQRLRGTPTPRITANNLALVMPTTRLGKSHMFGVGSRVPPGQKLSRTERYDSLNFWANESLERNLLPMTEEVISSIDAVTGHEKLELFAMIGAPRTSRIRQVFDDKRKGDLRLSEFRIIPSKQCGMIVMSLYGGGRITANFENGDSLHIGKNPFDLVFEMDTENEAIRFRDLQKTARRNPGGFWLSRPRRKKIFRSPERLNLAVRRMISAILLLDKPCALESKASYDASHPLLTGFDVPLRHRALIAAVLSEPYSKALFSAQARATRSEDAQIERDRKVKVLKDQLRAKKNGTWIE